MYFFIFNQDIPALKIAEHKIFIGRITESGGKCFEISNQFFLIVGKLKGIEKIIFEIQQVTQDGLFAKFAGSKAPVFIIQSAISLYLQVREFFQALPEQIINLVVRPLLFQPVQQ